ncbi:signal transduction histidine kinase [Paenibacillus sp. PvP094]|uniref:sensor histidine kinase n=1 Tax=Paenibacillus sp. PvP094 TaxID=3156394 RepID=UPI0033917400
MEKRKSLRFRTNSKLEKLIGRELITNNTIAFFELIKNSYDAGAKKVNIRFEGVESYSAVHSDNKKTDYFIGDNKVGADTIITNSDSCIIISDNGNGMSSEEVNKYWMEIGVVHKELIKQIDINDDTINRMYKRVLNGEKGIGRFSTDKLGAKLELSAIDKECKEKTVVNFDWDKYNDHTLLIEDIEHDYSITYLKDTKNSGVILKISNLRDEWSIRDVEELKRQLKKFVSPFSQEQNIFSIIFSINNNQEKIINDSFDYSLTSITASIGDDGILNYTIEDSQQTIIDKIDLPSPLFGPASLKIIYMDSAAKRSFTRKTGLSSRQYGNIKVFRDNFRIFPYGEPENDWLNIDNKHAQAVFRSLGTRDIIGYVQISNLSNKGLKDATDRVGLVEDTKEFEEFKKFIWNCIELLQNHIFKKLKKEAEQQGKIIDFTIENRKKAEDSFRNEVISVINNTDMPKLAANKIINLIEQNNKQLKKDLDNVKKANVELSKKIKVFERITGAEGLLYELLHTVKNKTAILDSKFNKILIQTQKLNIHIESENIKGVLKTINKLIDSALRKASSSRLTKKIEIVSDIIEESIAENKVLCESKGISIDYSFNDSYKRSYVNKESIKVVLDNLFSNSIKALAGYSSTNKLITISTSSTNNQHIEIVFQDNGPGIQVDDAPFIFNVSYTTTKGNGIGLSNSLDIIQSHDGDIVYFEEVNKSNGAAFLIKLPIKG